MKRKSSGFTIVELLIVIVIIGILASLVIVAYNGIQVRAKNTSRIASAKELQKLMSAYIAQEGKYPGGSSRVCLGTGYTTWASTGTYDCRGPVGETANVSAAIDTELQKIANIPKIEVSEAVATNGTVSRGYIYFPAVTIDSQAGRVMMTYSLEGSGQNCGIPGVLTYTGSGQVYTISGAINTNRNIPGVTTCYVAVAEP